jgi:hypothetical protein
MSNGKVVTMDEARAEQCHNAIAAVLEKYQCNLVTEQRVINGICMETRIYSVPRKPKLQQ